MDREPTPSNTLGNRITGRAYREGLTNRRLTANLEREDDGYVALGPEVDIASQGASVVLVRNNLAEALALFLETAPAEEVDRRLQGGVYVTRIEVTVGRAARPVGT